MDVCVASVVEIPSRVGLGEDEIHLAAQLLVVRGRNCRHECVHPSPQGRTHRQHTHRGHLPWRRCILDLLLQIKLLAHWAVSYGRRLISNLRARICDGVKAVL